MEPKTTTKSRRTSTATTALLCAAALASAAAAGGLPPPLDPPLPPRPKLTKADRAVIDQVSKQMGFDFVTIGAPGNRGAFLHEMGDGGWATTPYHQTPNRGKVDYSYKLNRLPASVEQYVQFVRVFKPFWQQIGDIPGHVESGFGINFSLSGQGIDAAFGNPGTVKSGWENTAADPTWRNAARFMNWLHHGAPTTDLNWETFHTGAYEFTDAHFTSMNSGTPLTRNADARFFLPTLDEWIKAAHYDPDKSGEGKEGYWWFATSTDTQPVQGQEFYYEGDNPFADPLRIGQFPNVTSPWGLLDTAMVTEFWTETPGWTLAENGEFVHRPGERSRSATGFESLGQWDEEVTEWTGQSVFRIGVAVPAPGAMLTLLGGAVVVLRRSR